MHVVNATLLYVVQQYRAPSYANSMDTQRMFKVLDPYVRLRELVHGGVISEASTFDRKDSRTPAYVNMYPQE